MGKTHIWHRRLAVGVAGVLLSAMSVPASAQMVISANDGKAALVGGQTVVPAAVKPDSVLILDVGGKAPRIVAEVPVATSVIGPPQSVAISPDGRFALVTAATKLDPADPTKTVPDDKVSVVDLTSRTVTQTMQAGPGASGVSINPAGTLALVANRSEDTVSVFTIDGGKLTPLGKVFFAEGSSPSLAVFTPDGTKALLTRDGDSRISVLAIDGSKVTDTGYAIYAGLRPYAIELAGRGDIAVVANIGVGGRDNDTISLIDLQSNPMHVVYSASVPPSPEGLALSADGKYVAASSINGTNFARGTPGFHDTGMVTVFARDGFTLRKVAEAKAGRWCEGMVWSTDHRKLLLQCMADNEIEVFSFGAHGLRRTGAIPVSNGPAGLRVAYNVAVAGDGATSPAQAAKANKIRNSGRKTSRRRH